MATSLFLTLGLSLGIPKNTKVLSPTAKALIKGIVGSKGSGDVYDPRGPTYMPPSIDKDQYSNVKSPHSSHMLPIVDALPSGAPSAATSA